MPHCNGMVSAPELCVKQATAASPFAWNDSRAAKKNKGLTSRNWTSPTSPKALTTSLPISFAMYSCVKDMSLDRNNVSLGTAMVGRVGQAWRSEPLRGSTKSFRGTRLTDEG